MACCCTGRCRIGQGCGASGQTYVPPATNYYINQWICKQCGHLNSTLNSKCWYCKNWWTGMETARITYRNYSQDSGGNWSY